MKKTISEKIRDLREDSDLRQEDVAQYLGIKQKMYSRYENNETALPLRHLIRLCQLYHVSSDYILGLSSEKQPYKKIKK